MEDDFGVAYQQTSDEKDLEYAFFGIFDGHGGKEAALFAKVNFIFDIFNHFKKTQDISKCCFVFQEHLMDYIVTQKGFWEEEDDAVLKAIREGFIQTHYAMWKELGIKIKLPKLNQIKRIVILIYRFIYQCYTFVIVETRQNLSDNFILLISISKLQLSYCLSVNSSSSTFYL